MPSKLKGPPFPAIRKIHGAGFQLEEVQRAVDEGTLGARKNPENQGRKIEGVSVPVSPNTFTINHKLGRRPDGIRAIRSTGAECRFHETFRDSRKIVLQSDGATACIADFWVH